MRSVKHLLATAGLILTIPLSAQVRTYAGTFSSNWKTVGFHGHDQPMCAERRTTVFPEAVLVEGPNCNPSDFGRGNLDNSIGFRGGRERDLFSVGPLSLVGGVEGSLSYTEYNLTQMDFVFAAAALVGGADLRLGPVRVGGRFGAGPFATTDSQEYGLQRFQGLHITVPLRPGAALRISQQSMKVFATAAPAPMFDAGPAEVRQMREPNAIETSVLLVASPEYLGSSKWDFSATTGTTSPGGPLGSGRGLRQSNFSQITAFRDLPRAGLQARVAWTASAHESQLPTMFRGFDNNFRSKTIDGFAAGVGRTSDRFFNHFSARYGAGVEIADWRDEHQLLTRDGQELIAGVEVGLSSDFGVRWHIGRNVALETSFEKIYWQGMDLGEGRWGFGLVVTR